MSDHVRQLTRERDRIRLLRHQGTKEHQASASWCCFVSLCLSGGSRGGPPTYRQNRHHIGIYASALLLPSPSDASNQTQGNPRNVQTDRFEEAFKELSDHLVFLKAGPILDGLRAEPRFADLLRWVGLDR